ncbi:beta-glucosidase [Phycicoccus sp. Soil803]|uniref:beta-glucosidase family protein n=1 Tax=Phycicoccus sp. Soil803 TaxID=1736415 RepID=UPI00070E8570|nr:glycoside hydrolase family 3 protein [Phycicoccus sp. Soil803]KRF23234.1 glycosyl hydrolase [Phycicoccus sp. Soil803]
MTTTDFAPLVAQLDLETKVRLLTGATSFTLHGADEIGLAPMAFSDGPTGVRGLKFVGGDHVALFPNATLLASAWSEETAHEVGEMLAEEAERQQIHVVLGPTINLHRSPLGGRLFEAYSEDPLLTGRLAAAYVKGLQGKGIGACLKHLVANESETLRNYMNSVVAEDVLREVYLLPFEIAVEESQPWSIMAAYNDVNGVPATEQVHVNTEVVKDEWGWDGLLMSDWFATKTSAPAALGGLDLVMPGPDGPWGEALVADVRAGAVDESVIDEHVCRLLLLAQRVGALDVPGSTEGHRSWPTDSLAADAPERRAQLRRLATDGMVVLRNADGVLPLAGGTTDGSGAAGGSVALIGRHGIETVCMGGGSAQVNPPHQVSIADGLREQLGERLVVVDGVDVRESPLPAALEAIQDPSTGEPGMRVEHVDAEGVVMLEEHVDGAEVTTGWDDTLPRQTEQLRLSARLVTGGRVRVGAKGAGSWRVSVDGTEIGRADLVSGGADPGEAMFKPPVWTADLEAAAGALVEAELTVVRSEPVPGPDGKLSTLSQILASGMGTKTLVVAPVPAPVDETLAAAAAAAQAADVAVVVVGLTPEQETEGSDKTTLALPGEQDALVRAVAAAATRTVVVVNAATPVLMPWADEVDAILVVGLPGQEGGHAVADALLGVREPAGRLVTTWPAADEAAPAWTVEPTDLQLDYTDGSFVGYRGFHAGRAAAPAHWLGAGDGYGAWDYTAAALTGSGADASPTVSVAVRNTAGRDSRELVQVYLQPSEADQPVRLVGWSTVDVAAGESATVEVTTDPRLWRRWDTAADGWASLADGGELLVARGLGDIRFRLPLA